MNKWGGRNQNNSPIEVDRFMEKVNKTEYCWLWTASLNYLGYGQFSVKSKMKKAHRYSYELFIGKIPAGIKVLHKCDVRNCVKPDHLFIGTQADNVLDMCKKGRNVAIPMRGEDNGMAKLTQEKVKEMREIRKNIGLSYTKIAKLFNVSQMAAYRAINRQSWK